MAKKTARPLCPLALVASTGALLCSALLAACRDSDAPGSGSAGAAAVPGPEAGKPAGGPQGAKPAARGQKGQASAMLAYQTGLQLLLEGDPEKAVGEFQRATQLDPQMAEAFHEMGRLQVNLSLQNVGSPARDQDVLDKGIAALEKARDLEPNNDHYWFWVGRAYAKKNDLPRAIENLTRAVELNPKNGGAWKSLGLAQRDSSSEAAQASFQKAIENDPEDAGAHFQLGQMCDVLLDLAGARAAYERSIELDPTQPEVYVNLSQVCGKLGDAEGEARARAGFEQWQEYDQRLKKRQRAVNLKPGDAVAVRRLGEIYFEVGKWEEALEWFVKSIHVDSKDALAHLYCGIVRRHLKDYENAANHLKEAEFLAPDNLDPKLELLRLYAETGDEKNAGELVAAVETAAVEDGEALYALAEVCQELGRVEHAERLFEKARSLGVTAAPPPAAAAGEGQ